MPISSTMGYIRDLLDGQSLPGCADLLEAFVTPPDPEVEARNPHAYVWLARGQEQIATSPRSQPQAGMTTYRPSQPAGWKFQRHNIDIYLTWFDDGSDNQQDSNFPLVVDGVMNILRTTKMQQPITDPASGFQSWLQDLGKNMSYEYAPLRGTASQRIHRFDAMITAPVEEWFQA